MFEPVRVRRTTAETRFEVVLEPRTEPAASLPLPNLLLSHFIDHLTRAAGVTVRSVDTDWPGSFRFDHVLCEDLGQLVGRGLAAIHERRATLSGVAGRSHAVCAMDDAEAEVTLSFEGRPRVDWANDAAVDLDGFVDAWYGDDGRMEGLGQGTNLRQFVDGLALGSGATLSIRARRAGNLHHFYEALFRALGDAIGGALGTADRLPGESSGLARFCDYSVHREGE